MIKAEDKYINWGSVLVGGSMGDSDIFKQMS